MYWSAMMTRLLVGILTPAMRAIRSILHFSGASCEKPKRRGPKPTRRPVEAGPCREPTKRKKSHALAMASGPRTYSGWRAYNPAVTPRQPARPEAKAIFAGGIAGALLAPQPRSATVTKRAVGHPGRLRPVPCVNFETPS